MNRVNIPISTIDLIGSHGQAIWHNATGGQVSSTLQLGDPSVIAICIGVTTVDNFRVADVATGGLGAPRVSTFENRQILGQSAPGNTYTKLTSKINTG